MTDLRNTLDSTMLAWLQTLEAIIGFKAEVNVGPGGESLHFRWCLRGPGSHFLEISFHDDNWLDYRWFCTLPCGHDGTDDIYPDYPREEEYHVAFGRIPRSLVIEMKRVQAYQVSIPLVGS